jgi:uncharacterized Rmd1/YagE family protein
MSSPFEKDHHICKLADTRSKSKLTSRTKLSLSHALAQSVKISLFEELISSTIEQTKDIPRSLSETGKIGLPRSEIMKQIGNLFILRININLVGSILDSPVRYSENIWRG